MSEHVTEYAVVAAGSRKELVTAINRFISKGWTPLGGVSAVSDAQGERFLQAMVKTGNWTV